MSHQCPVQGCMTRVDTQQLLCRAHWRSVPFLTRRRVLTAWAYGAGKGTDEHRDAMQEAIAAANAAVEERG